MANTHHPGEVIDVAGYTYILWDRAPSAGSWHATRESSNGTIAVIVRKVTNRGVQRWKVVGQAPSDLPVPAAPHAVPAAPVAPTPAKAVARASDPSTSKMAAERVAPRTGTLKYRLLVEYRRALTTGLTDYEAAASANLTMVGYWKRCSDLRNEGFIAPILNESGSVKVRYSANGDANMVCAITDSGLAALPTTSESDVHPVDSVPSVDPPDSPHTCHPSGLTYDDGCEACTREQKPGPCDICGQHNGHDRQCPEW